MRRVTVVDSDGVEHGFSSTGPHEDYQVHEDPWTGELVVEHVTYGRRGLSVRARTGSQVVGAWPAGTWHRACLHSPIEPAGVTSPATPADEHDATDAGPDPDDAATEGAVAQS